MKGLSLLIYEYNITYLFIVSYLVYYWLYPPGIVGSSNQSVTSNDSLHALYTLTLHTQYGYWLTSEQYSTSQYRMMQHGDVYCLEQMVLCV